MQSAPPNTHISLSAKCEDVSCQTDHETKDIKETMTSLTLEGIDWMESEATRLRVSIVTFLFNV